MHKKNDRNRVIEKGRKNGENTEWKKKGRKNEEKEIDRKNVRERVKEKGRIKKERKKERKKVKVEEVARREHAHPLDRSLGFACL